MNPYIENVAKQYDDEFVQDTGISGDRVFEVFCGIIFIPMITLLIILGILALI